MQEIRFHGRGGQGAVVASKILALAISSEGSYIQAFPEFGVERRGAPVTAYLRVHDQPIYEKSKIYKPDHLLVLDPTLVKAVDITKGLKEGGWIVLNSERSPDQIDISGPFRIATVDATAIAGKHGLGPRTSPIVNTAILGAVIRVLPLCAFASIEQAILEDAPLKKQENIEAAREAYEHVRGVA